MSLSHVLACDHRDPAPEPGPGQWSSMQDSRECPAISRAAASDAALRTVAVRDGWLIDDSGRHLCPRHSGVMLAVGA